MALFNMLLMYLLRQNPELHLENTVRDMLIQILFH